MATIRAKFRTSAQPLLMGKVYYQVIHKRIVKRIDSGLSLYPSEWEAAKGIAAQVPGPRALAVKSASAIIDSDLALLRDVVADLDRQGCEYSAADVAKGFAIRKSSGSFFAFMKQEISRKNALRKEGTAQNYRAAYNSFSNFLGNADLPVSRLTGETMQAYQAWLKSRGLTSNSMSFYMRILRCVYNHAAKQGLTPDRKPFDDVYTGVERTRKRAIPEADIKRIKKLDLADSPGLQRARDLFLLSFYCMGIAFVDLALLKKSNIAAGRLTYRRAKTGQTISVAMNPKMAALFHKYASGPESPFLIDIVSNPNADVRRQRINQLNLVNRYLKRVGEMAGLQAPLTTYVSRHSWASIARSKNVNISTISLALGHENEATTQIYLASLDNEPVDNANELILRNI